MPKIHSIIFGATLYPLSHLWYSYMMISYNISRPNLSAAISITPGKKAPTISPLEGTVYGDCKSIV